MATSGVFPSVHMHSHPVLVARWNKLSPELQCGMVRGRIDIPLVFHSCVGGNLEELAELAVEMGGGRAEAPLLLELWELCTRPAARAVATVAGTSMIDVSVHAAVNARKRESLGNVTHIERVACDPRPQGGIPMTTVPAVKRSRALEGHPKARELAEEARRAKWVEALCDIMRASPMPRPTSTTGDADFDFIFSSAGQGRRASTIRRRVLDWRLAARYFSMTFGCTWRSMVLAAVGPQAVELLLLIVEARSGDFS